MITLQDIQSALPPGVTAQAWPNNADSDSLIRLAKDGIGCDMRIPAAEMAGQLGAFRVKFIEPALRVLRLNNQKVAG